MPTAGPSSAHVNRLSGVQCAVLAAACFSLMSLSVKLIGQRIPVMELVCARALVVASLAGADLARRRVSLTGQLVPWLWVRSFVGFVALSFFYYSVVHLPLAEATVIHFTNPVLTTLIAMVFLRETLRLRELALVGGGLLGVVIILRPAGLLGATEPLPLAAASSGLVSALLAAVAYVIVRKLRRLDFMVVVFCFAMVSGLCSAPLMVPDAVLPQGREWLLLGAVGLATFFGQVFLTLALQREQAGRVTGIGYLQIVFATTWGALIFAQLPAPTTVIGAVIVVGSSLLLARWRSSAARTAETGASR